MSELNNILEWIKAYFDEKAKKNIQFVPLSRDCINVHGTNIREYLLNDDIDSFKKYTNQNSIIYITISDQEFLICIIKKIKEEYLKHIQFYLNIRNVH